MPGRNLLQDNQVQTNTVDWEAMRNASSLYNEPTEAAESDSRVYLSVEDTRDSRLNAIRFIEHTLESYFYDDNNGKRRTLQYILDGIPRGRDNNR